MCGLCGDEVAGPVEAQRPESEEPEEMQPDGARQAGPTPRKKPELPSVKEQELHNTTHYPFRSWCKWCVQGRKPNWGHYSLPEEAHEEKGPEIHMDYCFFREGEGEENVPCLVVK